LIFLLTSKFFSVQGCHQSLMCLCCCLPWHITKQRVGLKPNSKHQKPRATVKSQEWLSMSRVAVNVKSGCQKPRASTESQGQGPKAKSEHEKPRAAVKSEWQAPKAKDNHQKRRPAAENGDKAPKAYQTQSNAIRRPEQSEIDGTNL
jgi:hypothetical protein